jgi:predicted glycoside hydrolase/deacetylase ChbG (UPF0249 family)
MRNIIINSDDLGVNEIVNKEIARLLNYQKISSATIMANGKAFDEVKEIVDNNPQASFGVHLVMDEFTSMTKNPVLYKAGIIDKAGNFIRGAIYKQNRIDRNLKLAVYNELFAQVSKIVDSGIKISHFDSHHHFHINNSLFGIISDLAHDFNIKKIRRPFYFSPNYFMVVRKQKKSSLGYSSSIKPGDNVRNSKIKNIIAMADTVYNNMLWATNAKKIFQLTNEFHSYFGYYSYLSNIKSNQKDSKVLELMCHPGHPLYLEETKMVENELLRKVLDYRLISYNEV